MHSSTSLLRTRPRGAASLIVIIILILAIIGLVVWYALAGQRGVNQTATPSTDAYLNWKTQTSKYEQLSFKYPSDWTFKDLSNEGYSKELAKEVKGPVERYQIVSPSGLALNFGTHAAGFGGACMKVGESTDTSGYCPDVKTISVEPIAGATKYGLNIVTSETLDTTSKKVTTRQMGVMSKTYQGSLPSVGTLINTYPYNLTFNAAGTDKLASGGEYVSGFFVSTSIPGSGNISQDDLNAYKAKVLKPDMSAKDYFDQSEWTTIRQIFESVTVTN